MIPAQNIFTKFRVIKGISYLALNYELFELNDVGQFIWESIDGQRDIEKISENVATEFNVHIDTVNDDVQEFIKVLIGKELAEV